MIYRRAGSKINFSLQVGARLANGFHPIDSIFIPLPFPRDELWLEKSPASGIQLVCSPEFTPDEKNILTRAYAIFAAKTGCDQAVKVILRKGVPIGSGLGGGSSDAAVLLTWLAEISPQEISSDQLLAIARETGSDVPFFMFNSPCRVRGTGEIIEPARLRLSGEAHVVLVWPGFAVATAQAYRDFDALKQWTAAADVLTKAHAGSKKAGPPREELDPLSDCAGNDLEEPVFRRYPQLARLRDEMLLLGARKAAMSGSGSTIFGLFDQRDLARRAVTSLHVKFKHVFYATLSNTGM